MSNHEELSLILCQHRPPERQDMLAKVSIREPF